MITKERRLFANDLERRHVRDDRLSVFGRRHEHDAAQKVKKFLFVFRFVVKHRDKASGFSTEAQKPISNEVQNLDYTLLFFGTF